MKLLITLLYFFILTENIFAQGGAPAGFAVQGGMQANSPVTGKDDWFPRSPGVGKGVIDTAGVGPLIVNILANKSYTFTRRMVFPKYSVQNSRLFMDAVYGRDGNQGSTDITAFLGSATKNCANPMTEWYGGAGNLGSSSNDLVDVMAHARRSGTNVHDSLWLYGGVSFTGAGGAHFYDYELYQSEITFINPPLWSQAHFINSGPDEGHTAWRFNSAGNLIKAGDLIVAVSFDNAGVASVEVRLWVKETDYNTVAPTAFSWGGMFDKFSNSNQYGYGKINFPAANFFYQVNSAVTPIPAAPWGTINPGPAYSSTMAQFKFFEFGVNLTGLGIDPNQISGSADACNAGFKKLMVKSRTGNSFGADLKDFAGPYDFLNILPVDVNIGPDRQLCVGRDTILLSSNPSVSGYGNFHWTSVYGDGIVSNPDSTAIYVNMPGIYIVQSYIYPGCAVSDADTVIVRNTAGCSVLPQNDIRLRGSLRQTDRYLGWTPVTDADAESLTLQYSSNGTVFYHLADLPKTAIEYTDRRSVSGTAYYRILTSKRSGLYKTVSNIVMLNTPGFENISIQKIKGQSNIKIINTGNPVVNGFVSIFDETGKAIYSSKISGTAVSNILYVNKPLAPGIYFYRLVSDKFSGSGKIQWD